MKLKVVFLYTELAEYFLACIKALLEEHAVEAHIIRWPINKEAPFKFTIPAGATVYEKQDYNREQLIQLCQNLKPSLIFCSGWIDKDYLAVVRSFKKRIPVLVGMDNHWNGSAKQQVARLLAPFTLQRLFTHAFVAGAPQKQYALKLGFKEQHILQGYYSADVAHFQKAYEDARGDKTKGLPKRMLYVGRYISHKGVQDMWQAFVELQEEQPNVWELWCLGTGSLEGVAVKHPKIKHFGFVQPKQMQSYISQTGVFILPSHFEPWGVVVHEFAAAGFVLLCSDKVGAATAYLENQVNGFSFKAGDMAALKEAMKKVVALSDEQLLQMGERSVELALQNTPTIWAAKLMGLVER